MCWITEAGGTEVSEEVNLNIWTEPFVGEVKLVSTGTTTQTNPDDSNHNFSLNTTMHMHNP